VEKQDGKRGKKRKSVKIFSQADPDKNGINFLTKGLVQGEKIPKRRSKHFLEILI
jgi:hypothetical protein